MTTTRRRVSQLTLTIATTLTLAACGPAGSGGGMGPGGMGSGGMGGGMGAGGGADGNGIGNAGGDDHDEARDSEPISGAREIAVEAGDVYFEPDTIRIQAGEPANITVTNVGDAFHDFTLPELDVMIDVPAGATATAGLTVTEPGEYTYECTVPGHASAGMTGTLVVTE